MEMLEVWQIRLALIVFLALADWLGYLGMSYWINKVRPRYFWRSLLIPITIGLPLLLLTGLPETSVGEQVLLTLTLLGISIVPYGILLILDGLAAEKLRQESRIPNRGGSAIVATFLGFVLGVLNLLPLTAYAKNISNYSFKRQSLEVTFPELLCYPKAIHTAVVGNEIVYQVWAKYSTFADSDKAIIIEISSGGETDRTLKLADWDINRKHPGFPMLKFQCDPDHTEYDQWILIKASAVTLLQSQ